MYVCARIENDLVEEPEELAGEAPEQQLVGRGKCPLTHLCPIYSLIHLPHFTFISKNLLAFVIHVLVYLFGLDYYGLALCYCSTLINEHDENYYRRFNPGGSLDRRVNCRCVSQPRWVGARRRHKGGKQ
jgi:hypothetical protein